MLKINSRFLFRGCAALVAMHALSLLALHAHAAPFVATNLVTDDQGAHAAQITDDHLVNAWGISSSGSSPFWVSSNTGHLSALYSVDPMTNSTAKVGLEVTIPGEGSVTGQVFNPTSGFNSDRFLFVSEDGTISGWRSAFGTTGQVPAEVIATASPDNSYKGVALATIGNNTYLYAANFKANTIDVLKGNAGAPDLTGKFTDPTLPAGYAPFNIQLLGGKLYVTYAVRNPITGDDVPGVGNGFVSVFDTEGNFLARVGSKGTLNSPWGLALAPASFGALAGDLLVGNFGDGFINAFDIGTDSFVGQLDGLDGKPLSIDGLWALRTGNDGAGGSSQAIYFSAGPDSEGHGLFGVLQAAPEPSVLLLLVAALVGIQAMRRRR
jgi:uncharacterized protein (TIGR03118 family)